MQGWGWLRCFDSTKVQDHCKISILNTNLISDFTSALRKLTKWHLGEKVTQCISFPIFSSAA